MASIFLNAPFDPATVLGETPCFECLSKTQLKMVLLYVWAYIEGYTLPDDLNQMLTDAACNINCINSEKDQLIQELECIASRVLAEGPDVPNIQDAMKCVLCLKPGQIDGLLTYLKCKFWTQGPD